MPVMRELRGGHMYDTPTIHKVAGSEPFSKAAGDRLRRQSMKSRRVSANRDSALLVGGTDLAGAAEVADRHPLLGQFLVVGVRGGVFPPG